MGRRKLEEIFEECLSALLEGRRSIEESLSLYPSLADELEPLLRAAAEIAPAFHYDPPAGYREEARQRFLAAAAARRGRQQAGAGDELRSWWRWGAVVAAATAGLSVLALVNATLMDGGGGGGFPAPVSVRLITPTPPPAAVNLEMPLQRAKANLATLETAVEQERPVAPALIREVKATSKQIAAQLGDPSALKGEGRIALLRLASRQYELLSRARSLVCGVQAQELDETLDVVGEVLEKLGVPPEPQASPTPQPSPAPSPTSQVSPTPATPASTLQPCPVASPTPASSPTPQASPTPASPTSTPQP